MSGYTPVFDSVYAGTLCGRWPATPVWVSLLPLCDKHGHIDLSYQTISALTGWPMDLLKQGIAELMQPDPESRSSAEEGRRLVLLDPGNRNWGWRAVNHGLYREKARKLQYDTERTASGRDAARKRSAREPADSSPAMSRDVPRCPDDSRDIPLSDADSDADSDSDSDNKNSVRAAEPPTDGTDADRIWSLGVQILGESSRSLLGRLVKQHGREKVASKIGELSAMAPPPVDPKSWLVGVLKPREERPSRFRTA